MFNLIGKIKFHSGRISHFTSFSSSAPKLFALPSSPWNTSNSYSQTSNQYSYPIPATNLQNPYPFYPENDALVSSNHLRSNSPENRNSVIAFFKNHNFADTQISTIVEKWPSVFNHHPNFTFRPKIEFFSDLGLSSSDIVKILTRAPYLLERSLQYQLIPVVDFIRSYLRFDRDVVVSIKRYPYILDAKLHDTLLHNVGILRVAGVPNEHIAFLLQTSPGKLAVQPENFNAMVEMLQKQGLEPHRRNFITGIVVMRQLSSLSWREKIDTYVLFGWSEYEVLDAFRKHPRFMAASTDKINRALELLADRMGCNPTVLIKKPQILTSSFERTLVPRCAFYQVLVAKRLVEQGSLLEMMDCLSGVSVESFVTSYADRDQRLLEVYIRKFLASRKNRSFVERCL